MMLATVVSGWSPFSATSRDLQQPDRVENLIARSWATSTSSPAAPRRAAKLVSVCEGYMQHERHVFDKLSEARGALVRARGVSRAGAGGEPASPARWPVLAVAEA